MKKEKAYKWLSKNAIKIIKLEIYEDYDVYIIKVNGSYVDVNINTDDPSILIKLSNIIYKCTNLKRLTMKTRFYNEGNFLSHMKTPIDTLEELSITGLRGVNKKFIGKNLKKMSISVLDVRYLIVDFDLSYLNSINIKMTENKIKKTPYMKKLPKKYIIDDDGDEEYDIFSLIDQNENGSDDFNDDFNLENENKFFKYLNSMILMGYEINMDHYEIVTNPKIKNKILQLINRIKALPSYVACKTINKSICNQHNLPEDIQKHINKYFGFGNKKKKVLTKSLKNQAKKYKVRLTLKRGNKRVYKSEKMLKNQIKNKKLLFK
jgi:hypothetical protein